MESVKRRLSYTFAIFVVFYFVNIMFISLFGFYNKIICSLTARWMVEILGPIFYEIPGILAIVYLHHKTFEDEKSHHSI
jgi:uncharacterized protein YybS (DUF2232 family)